MKSAMMKRFVESGFDIGRMIAKYRMIRRKLATEKRKWMWFTEDELLIKYNQNKSLVERLIDSKTLYGMVREHPEIPDFYQYKCLHDDSSIVSDEKMFEQELEWKAELEGTAASASLSAMESGVGNCLAIGDVAAAVPQSAGQSSPANTGGTGQGSNSSPGNGGTDGKNCQGGKNKEEIEAEKLAKKAQKLAALPERVVLNDVESLETTIEDFNGKLFTCCHEASMHAALLKHLPQQFSLHDSLMKSHTDMLTSFHALDSKLRECKAKKKRVEKSDVSQLMGTAIKLVEEFRRLEVQAKPLTKIARSKPKRQKKTKE